MRRAGWIITAAVLAYTALFYADLLFERRVTVFRDQYTIVMAIDWVVRFLSQWTWPPLWTPYQVLGKPLLAEPLAAIFYPLNWGARLLPFPLGYNASVAAHHALAFAGTYLLLRQRQAQREAAALGGLLFAFGGLCVAFDNMINALQSAVWLPWTLLAFDRWCTRRGSAALAATAIGLALTLLGGMPEVFGFALALCLVTAVDRRRDGGARLPRAALALAAAALLGIGLGAVQLLPTAEYLAHSSRAGGLRTAGVVRLSLAPFGTLAFLVPRHYIDPTGAFHETAALWEGELADAPWAISLYLGPLLALLAAVDLPRARRRLWLAVGVVFLLLGWGGHLPGYTALVDSLPLLRTARYPEKFLLVVYLLLAAGAALGLDAALRDPRRFARAGAAALGLALACGAGALVAGYKPSFARNLLQRDLMIAAALLLGVFAVARLGRRRPQLAALALLGFAGVDLYRVNARLLPTLDWDELRRVPDSARAMASGVPPVRMYSDAVGRPAVAPFPDSTIQEQHLLLFEVANYFGLANLNAPASINLQDHELLSALTEQVPPPRVAPLFAAFNTQFVTSPKDLRRYPGLTPILAPRTPLEAYVYRVEGVTPRVYVPHTLLPMPRERVLASLRERDDPAEQLAVAADDLPAGASTTVVGNARLTAYRADDVEVQVQMDTDGLVVLTDTYYPGWEATVDDRPAPIVRANYFARGVHVPAGEHRLVFRYRPWPYRVGVWVSGVALLVLGTMLLWGRAR
ncbi:MAG: YfhO family protein [Deltaproteobacteria bacterium]|nr:YfhO family protein [Deltaproteobacteria bacterium]